MEVVTAADGRRLLEGVAVAAASAGHLDLLQVVRTYDYVLLGRRAAQRRRPRRRSFEVRLEILGRWRWHRHVARGVVDAHRVPGVDAPVNHRHVLVVNYVPGAAVKVRLPLCGNDADRLIKTLSGLSSTADLEIGKEKHTQTVPMKKEEKIITTTTSIFQSKIQNGLWSVWIVICEQFVFFVYGKIHCTAQVL